MPKPSIVFAHGLWADGSCFSKLIPTLLAEGYEVMASQHGLDSGGSPKGVSYPRPQPGDSCRPLLWWYINHARWDRCAGGRARLYRGSRAGCRRDLAELA